MARLSRKTTEMTARRYLTFSLRTLFVLLTALAVWLGVVVNRAREQREAVKAIEALGGVVYYDWQTRDVLPRLSIAPPLTVNTTFLSVSGPNAPSWLRRFIGDNYFQTAKSAAFGRFTPDTDIHKAVPALKRLRWLAFVHLPSRTSEEIKNIVKSAIPRCEVVIW